ncbi:MAG: response regulator [Chloroflexi bacterium]|nr:MAG: response regulator [Chloroflexota bacterium]
MKKEKILVVDDLPDVRATISGLLSDAGYDVRSTSNRSDALRLLRMDQFGAAILDIRLDETDEDNREGLLLMHEIKKDYPRIAIVILTGYADVKVVREALQPDQEGNIAAFGFLEKTELDQLNDYVARAMAHTMVNSSSSTRNLIEQGENERVEFKSSICWDYKTRSADKSIKSAIAKAIVGFLNSKGGTLFIGVADNGTVTGIEKDLEILPKKNQDGFQLELTNIISLHIGVEYLSNIHSRFEIINNRTVCIVSIEKSPTPVFLKNDDNKLWVRASNSTRYLGVKAAMNYIETNWKKTL